MMEAVAKYPYTASSPSELSFEANDTMNVSSLICWKRTMSSSSEYSMTVLVSRSFPMMSSGVVDE